MALPQPSPTACALVTGASSGIGAEIAKLLAARGHTLVLVARRRERLDALAAELAEAHGVRTEVVEADLADPDARKALADRLAELDLDVEVLVNNAGLGHYGDVSSSSVERELAMVNVNVVAVAELTARFLPVMAEHGRGAIINIASTAAFQPLPGNATYAATKAFVLAQGDAIHAELEGSGVTLTSVCPGPVKTEFAEQAGVGEAEEQLPGFLWQSAAEVAEAAVEGAEEGKRVVVPGALNRAAAIGVHFIPKFLQLPLTKQLMRRAL